MATATAEAKESTTPVSSGKAERRREWSPRMWQGMQFFGWLRLLIRNRFAVHLTHLYIAVIVTLVSFIHLLFRLLQEAIYGRRIRKTQLAAPPIFIIGHWRTGTTLMHEYLILDERHSYPSTYQCMEPNHFLISEEFMTRYMTILVPTTRPMDNMKAGFDRPQEDEFAMCMLGQPSPYLTIAFPNHAPQDQAFFDLEDISERQVRDWKRTFVHFLKTLTFHTPKRLILKSPPHTCRLKVLQELFPEALFVHIVRDPYIVFPSTVHLWSKLYQKHGLQKPSNAGLEEYVFQTFTHMYERLEATRHLVEPHRFYELRYEDLIADPVGQMQALYDHFGLGGFDVFRPRLEAYLAATQTYKTNKYEISSQQRAEITERWRAVIERYGYVQTAELSA